MPLVQGFELKARVLGIKDKAKNLDLWLKALDYCMELSQSSAGMRGQGTRLKDTLNTSYNRHSTPL